MDGHYPRRDEDKDTSVRDSFKDGANHYADTVRTSKDPLMGLIRDISGGAGDLGGKLRDRFTGAAGRNGDTGGPETGADPARRRTDRRRRPAGGGQSTGRGAGGRAEQAAAGGDRAVPVVRVDPGAGRGAVWPASSGRK